MDLITADLTAMTTEARDELASLRRRSKVSLQRLAARLTVDLSTISRWERTDKPERIPLFKWQGYELALRQEIAINAEAASA